MAALNAPVSEAAANTLRLPVIGAAVVVGPGGAVVDVGRELVDLDDDEQATKTSRSERAPPSGGAGAWSWVLLRGWGSRRRRWWPSTEATTSDPGARASSSAASRLISETTRNGPACTSTWAITLSLVTLVTRPGKWLRADSDAVVPGRGGADLAWA